MQHLVDLHDVTTDRDGSPVRVAVHHLVGGDGPRLGLVGAQHGDEWYVVRAMYELVRRAKDWPFTGTLSLVPVASPPALRDGTRITQASADEPDMNRIWTSERTWLTSQIVKTLAAEVIDKCDAVIDFHLGIWGSTFAGVCYAGDYPDRAVSERSRELAYAYGYQCVERLELMGVFPGPKSLAGYAGARLGIPAIGVEVGGAGFDLDQEREWLESFITGVRNVMSAMGMLHQDPPPASRVLETGPTIIVTPRNGGLMIPAREPEQLMRRVEKGELLASIISPQTLEPVEELVAPQGGWLFCAARCYLVRPGDWAFAIAPEEGAEWTDRTNL